MEIFIICTSRARWENVFQQWTGKWIWMIKNMNPSENLTLSKFCERIESDNKNLCITHKKLKPLILMIWTFFHRIIFKKKRFGIFFRVKSTTPRCRSSFYRVLLSLVVRHFWVSVTLNLFKQFYHHLCCPSSSIPGN